jgi:PASTA domain
MAQLNNVRPGDLIRAEDWNALVAAVQGGSVTTGITVPDLFGVNLSNAVAVLDLPSSQLVRGRVFDTYGDAIDPRSPSSIQLIVLGQSPSVGTTVPAGTTINLVVSPTPGSPSSGGVLATLGVTDVATNAGKGTYTAQTDTITLPKGATPVASITLQASAPNGNKTYKINGPTFDSVAWSGQAVQTSFTGPPPGQTVQTKIFVILIGSASTKMHYGFTCDQDASIFVNINPTIQLSAT